MYGDIPPFTVPLSYHCQPFTLTDNHPIGTAFYMVTYLLRDQHLFNHLHLRDLVRIHLSAARPKCAREVDLSTPSKGSWEMKSLTLHVSVNWHLRSGLRPFSRVSMTMGQRSSIRSPKTSLHLGQSSSCSTPSIGRPEAPLVQEGNLKTCHGALTTGLTEEKKRDS